ALHRGVTGELAPALARFGATLRAHGIAATVRDEIDAVQALRLVDRDDRDEVRAALRIALKIPREAWTAYDHLFTAFWTGADLIEPPDLQPQPPPRERRERPPARRRCFVARPSMRRRGPRRRWRRWSACSRDSRTVWRRVAAAAGYRRPARRCAAVWIRAAATAARSRPAARCCVSRAASAPSRSHAWSSCATPAGR